MKPYSVCLILENGSHCYLSVKGRTEWKTKAAARKHAADIQLLISKGANIFGAIAVHVEDTFGEII